LWQRYIDPAFRDRAPIGLTEDQGDCGWPTRQGLGRVAIDADRSRRRQGKNYALNEERWRPRASAAGRRRFSSSHDEGIDVAVVYPRGNVAPTTSTWTRSSPRPWRAYNDWRAEFYRDPSGSSAPA
jgi:hypothetical protein